jgi:hypothetical protein
MYAIESWLNSFAYRTSVGIDVFLFSLLSFGGIALMVISGNLIRGARASVAENLRRE